MEPGIENFAGVIIENGEGEILLVKKPDHYAYAIPWCRIIPGKSLQECLTERVRHLTGFTINPVFVGPSEHIEGNSHFISFDHLARLDSHGLQHSRDDLDYLWVRPADLNTIPLVPLTRSLLAKHCWEAPFEEG